MSLAAAAAAAVSAAAATLNADSPGSAATAPTAHVPRSGQQPGREGGGAGAWYGARAHTAPRPEG